MPPPEPAAELHALLLDTPEQLVEPVSEALFELGAGGVEERESTIGSCLVVYAPQRKTLLGWRSAIERRFGSLDWELEHVDPGWTEEWIRYLKPERVTSSFVMTPLGAEAETPPGTLAIVYQPSMTFGTGGHASTRLCAAALEAECRRRPGCRVLDVGSGSGVLSLVAALSGAGSVLGLDVDPVAVRSATRNAELNGLESTCRFSRTPLSELRDDFDVVVANIELRPLSTLLEELARVAAEGGQLLVSGILSEQGAQVVEPLERTGLDLVYARDEGEFRLLCLHKPAPAR